MNKWSRSRNWRDSNYFMLQFLKDERNPLLWTRKWLNLTLWGNGGFNVQLMQMHHGMEALRRIGFNDCRGASSPTSLEYALVVQCCNGYMTKPRGMWHRHGRYLGWSLQFTGCGISLLKFLFRTPQEDGKTLCQMNALKQWQRRWWFSVAFSEIWASFVRNLPSCVLAFPSRLFVSIPHKLGWSLLRFDNFEGCTFSA